MAKSDLLKEAIADAKAVKETALANAKIALEEAFAPRINAMLSAKLAEEYDDEDDVNSVDEHEVMYQDEEEESGMDMDMDMGMEPEMEPAMDMDGGDEDAESELSFADEAPADDLELEQIIRELEEDLNEEDSEVDYEAEMDLASEGMAMPPKDELERSDPLTGTPGMDDEYDIDEIIESILAEVDDVEVEEEEPVTEAQEEMANVKQDLEEAYDTIQSLRGTINEVNLLNAKLLYTNKLFRNFELDENQKMKVIENFDRAGNTREVKLVFSTLAESFHVPLKRRKKVVREGFASKTAGTTAPSTKTKQIINEGNALANRWKKLAGLLD
jgi:hypothetical protein